MVLSVPTEQQQQCSAASWLTVHHPHVIKHKVNGSSLVRETWWFGWSWFEIIQNTQNWEHWDFPRMFLAKDVCILFILKWVSCHGVTWRMVNSAVASMWGLHFPPPITCMFRWIGDSKLTSRCWITDSGSIVAPLLNQEKWCSQPASDIGRGKAHIIFTQSHPKKLKKDCRINWCLQLVHKLN